MRNFINILYSFWWIYFDLKALTSHLFLGAKFKSEINKRINVRSEILLALLIWFVKVIIFLDILDHFKELYKFVTSHPVLAREIQMKT